MKIHVLGLFAVLLLLCGGCGLPSERAHYKIACEAVRDREEVPDDAKLPRMREVEMHIGKNAGQVALSVTFTDERGREVTRPYTVETKRVARTWTLESCTPVTVYP